MSTPDPSETGVDPSPGGDVYQENPDFVPDSTMVTGTLDTSGTAGADDSKVENTTPVFDAAKAQDLQYAKGVVEGEIDDPGAVVNEGGGVTVSNSGRSTEEGENAVVEAAEKFEEDPVKVQDPSITNAEDNAESGASTDPAKVEANQKSSAPTGDGKSGKRTKDNPTA